MNIENKDRKMLVSKIENGIVIDKIPSGKSLTLLRVLHIKEEITDTAAVAINVNSQSMGKKDILKITNRSLSEEELQAIWLIAPNATVSTIENYNVIDKFVIDDKQINNEFSGVLKCNNPTCATNFNEPVKPKFILLDRDPLLVRCLYCDRIMLEENIREQL